METALSYANTDPQVLYKLGLAYYANEKYRRAIRVSIKHKLNRLSKTP
jgi:hypothetical protein